MLTIERSAAGTTAQVLPTPPPRITPVHDPVDRRHSDLSFSIDTGGRPCFRVLIARERSLFAPEQQSARNASNFYDSQREGLLPFDGLPCFYLVPRSALNALLPAPRLYYTLIAYDDRNGTRAVYALAPESLPREAPAVGVAADLAAGSLALMFGTPVERLMPVGAQWGWGQSVEEVGEDLAAEAPAMIGLAADDGDEPDGDEALAQAAGYDDGDDAADDVEPPRATMEAHAEAADEWGEDIDSTEPEQPAAQSLADGYDDGYDLPPAALPFGDSYRAEHESDSAQALDAPPRDPVPETLPDEDAETAGAAQGGDAGASDEVEIEGRAYGLDTDPAAPATPRRPFDIEACKAVLARIMPFESGHDGFARVEPDGEFAGRFGTVHPAYQRFHMGLSFGAFPFVQEHGTLGQLLALMRERDGAAFERIFGRDAATLVAVTGTADGPRAWESADGLSPRLKAVGGALLWQEPWLARFSDAGRHLPFQGAQNELAARLYVQPMLAAAAQLGLDSEQALTLLADRAVQMGPQAALAWVLEAVSPVRTPAHRQQVLSRLGHADLHAFQAAQHLPTSGEWDVASHLALIGVLRQRTDSPVPLPTREQMVDALLRRAEGTPWAERMGRLRQAAAADLLFQL